MHALLFTYQWRRAIRFFETNRIAKILTMLGFFAAFGVLIALVYGLFFYGFKYIARDEYFAQALTLYVIELFFLVSFLMVYASALLSGLFSLYRSENDTILMASPNFMLRLSSVFSRMFLSSLWPLLAIILPALVALHQVFGLSFLGLSLGVLSSILLIALSNVSAIVTLLFVSVIINQLGRFTTRRVTFGTLGVFALVLGVIWMRFRSIDLVEFFQARMLGTALPDIAPIIHQFQIFPTHLSALTLFFSQQGDYHHALLSIFYTFISLALLSLSFMLFKGEYLVLWQRGQEGRGAHKNGSVQRLASFMNRAKTPESAILRKEIIAFVRNGRGMLWVGFILLIWVIQSASSHMLTHGLRAERVGSADVPSITGALGFGVILYFISMFVLRFAFPSFSAEQKSMWSLKSAPLDMGTVFASKLTFFGSLFSCIALVFTVFSAFSVDLILPLGAPLTLSVLVGTFFLTTFGLSLGALYPNSETDDPERLSTTLTGIGFIVGSLCYGSIGAFTMRNFFITKNAGLLAGFLVVSLLLSLFLVLRVRAAFMRPTIISR